MDQKLREKAWGCGEQHQGKVIREVMVPNTHTGRWAVKNTLDREPAVRERTELGIMACS